MFQRDLFRETPGVSAMGRIWKDGTPLMVGHGAILLCLGMALCSLGSFMTNPKVEVLGYMVAIFLTAMCLIGQAIVACIRVLANKTWRRREFYIYILVGLFACACWVVFWLFRLAPLNMLVLLAGLEGLVWSLWYVEMTFYLHGSPRKAGTLSVLAGTTSTMGIILSTRSGLSDISAVTGVACYITWIGIQTLLTVPYLFRNWEERTAVEVLPVDLPLSSPGQ